MSARLREIARETVEIVAAGGYCIAAGRDGLGASSAGGPDARRRVEIGPRVAAAVAGTRLHGPEQDLRGYGAAAAPLIEVTGESTLAAARRMGPDAAALVFASARNPGGGFLTGAQAQEEAIARGSALYACLTTVPEFYAYHRSDRDLRYSDRVVYSPGVPVFRDDHDRLLDSPFTTSFLTAAAPNLGAILAAVGPADPRAAEADVAEVLHRRARRVLAVAAEHGHRTLILGAWGCGVFRNDPATVAAAFRDGLAEVGPFDRVVFAILDRLRGAPVRAAFEAAFA